MKIIQEFKEFIARGNVMDMAVGVVMGTAFKGIVDSLVEDIITPFISVLTGKVNIADLSLTITDELVIPYGNFIQNIINFLIIAVSVFAMVKAVNGVHRKFEKKQEEVAAAPSPTTEDLLCEIRDLLKK